MNNRVGMDLSGVTTATAPTSGTHLCNKTYVDAVTTGAFAHNSQSYPNVSYVVSGGNPTNASGGNNLNGRMDMPSGTTGSLEVEITPPSNANIKIDFSICGEWGSSNFAKGLIIARAAKAAADDSFTYTSLLRADDPAPATLAGRWVVPFCVNRNNSSTTMEQAMGFVIDSSVDANTTYRYIPVLVNTAGTGSSTFKLNRVYDVNNGLWNERGCSSITATIINI